MHIQNEIQELIRARRELEQRVKELDEKIEHIFVRLREAQSCVSLACPHDMGGHECPYHEPAARRQLK